ncbi:helix-turn-helix domain-containing protein [Corynebacterium sanguinis]|uniref:helix-turn-helix domain-containing protein n=1 Tax=Corynebacterium sanguinis TaxID=2594913 RepID=UPI0011852DCB|nr:helix-turn-helix domain-containing protein [Corynebacterium sanguinis]MCT2023187.1 helix-turn-helix domain-containing protein [Corynebacterium sanguinis]QDR77634.1 DNA-binding protein [Corynebacterium sanguinis]
MTQQTITRKWLTLKEAAVYTGYSVKTLRRRIQDGTLKASRTGRDYRVKTDDLDAMFQEVKVYN